MKHTAAEEFFSEESNYPDICIAPLFFLIMSLMPYLLPIIACAQHTDVHGKNRQTVNTALKRNQHLHFRFWAADGI